MRVIAIVVAAVLGVAASAQADRIDDARQRALTAEFQPTLPSDEAGSGSAGSGSAVGPDRRKQREEWHDTRGQRAREPEASSLMSFFLWGLLIVVAALAAFWIARDLFKYGDDAELPPDKPEPASDTEAAAIIERPLGDADELAQRGEFAEAIHTLLLRTLQELVRSAAVRVERSHTSREILARVPLLADSRDALAGLITAVELTHFGDEPANAADYEHCRQQFHRFATAFRATGLARRQGAAA